MKIRKLLLIVLAVQIPIILIFLWGYHQIAGDKTGNVDATSVFNDFRMKKQLEQQYLLIESERKNILDSLELRLKMTGDNIGEKKSIQKETLENFEYQKREFLLKRDEFEKMNQELRAQYNEQIWLRINQYAREYGDQEGYDFVFGFTGEAYLLYVGNKKDITKSFTEFINDKYDGR